MVSQNMLRSMFMKVVNSASGKAMRDQITTPYSSSVHPKNEDPRFRAHICFEFHYKAQDFQT